MKSKHTIVWISILTITMLISGCIETEDGETTMKLCTISMESVDQTPKSEIVPESTIIEVKYPVWATFNMVYNDIEYAGRFKLYQSGQCTMIMRSEQGNEIWHANYELVNRTDEILTYKIWGRNGVFVMDITGGALIMGDDIPETSGTWKHPHHAE